MDLSTSIQRSIKFLGVGGRKGNLGTHIYICFILSAIIATNMICYLLSTWDDLDERISVLKKLVFLLDFTMLYPLAFIGFWDEFSSFLNIITDSHFKTPNLTSSRRAYLISQMEIGMNEVFTKLIIVTILYQSSFAILPAISVIVKVIIYSDDLHNVITQPISTPYPLYYPKSIRKLIFSEWLSDISTYVIGYTFHFISIFFGANFVYFVYIPPQSVLLRIQYELKLLRLSLLENKDFKQDDNSLKEKEKMYQFVEYFNKHHLDIYRKVNIANVGIRWIAVIIGASTILYLCMSIYTIVQTNELLIKLQELYCCGAWLYGVCALDIAGEKIKTEDEKLRTALYEYPWLDKPMWFKKSLLIKMTRCCKPIDVKPFGVFTFNLREFFMRINAAYSYYNVLYRFKN